MKRILLLVAFGLVSSSQASLVFSQPPKATGGINSSSWIWENGSDSDMYAYDSFILPRNTSVSQITWRGGEAYGGIYGHVFDFQITFYDSTASDTQPYCGNPQLPEWYLANYMVGGTANPVPAGVFGGVAMYDYSFNLPTPFVATAGHKYWVRIEGYQAGYPDWGVASANGGNGSHFVFSTGAARFSFYPNDLTFSLFDHAVAGNVELQEMVVSPTGKQVTFQLISGATVVETRTANLDGSGNYYFSTNRTGLYDITAKASHWLRQRVYDVDLSAAGASGVMFSLVNGDVDNDNEITLADYGILSAAFGTALGDPTYDARADLNGDDEVNLADYAILARNFGLAGD